MVRVIAALVRLPVFSVAHPESFQILSALPVPQPSSLIGALGYAIGVYEGKGTKALNELRELVIKGEVLAARAKLQENGQLNYPLIPSSVILRRFRIMDKAHETKKKGEIKPIERLKSSLNAREIETVKRILEIELMDAFYREYVMGLNLLCVWIFKGKGFEDEVIKNIHRLGDTESLCTVLEVSSEESPLVHKRAVTTKFPAPINEKCTLSGDFILTKMCDEKRELKTFVVPLRQEIEKKGRLRYPVVWPSTVKIDYGEEIVVCETQQWGDIVIGG
ncbi:MAG: type I-A CRISPR-associated protein Cas5 [Thermoproteota archaeon]|jgi:CRISPR-associated protein Cas5 subtype I-A|uniref:Type I-A CRISPR-associated protein Cas5 n=1 Tax=Candidatus Methanodesulfokora washburnensis TaxID=2478471 RepID=A0A520KHX6_9CREN|nr:MAG: type I-A CRISPR-associated protein Cas5 [Candidatus Methanodesulfokores washburnensis]TDA39495.1 MAG: type I-A CRISPR-associated protein Cas5 [Candidatus Korarchaeota archaeon]